MSYEFYKQKIPRTHQFPLQRSKLDAALAAAGVEQLATVLFNSRPTWVPEQLLVVAHYTPEGITQGYAPPDSFGFWSYHPGTTSVVVYAVPKSESLLSARLLEEQGLQRLCAWLAKAEHEDQVWRWNGHQLRLDVDDG